MIPIDNKTELFRLHQINKQYGPILALQNISLELFAPCCVVVLGPNGSGKSTLLQLLAGVIRPTSGKIFFHASQTPNRRRIGFVSHFPLLYNDLTVRENLHYFSTMYGIFPVEPFMNKAVQTMGIEALSDYPFRDLSRGQQQRVSIARALLHQPDVLIMDEPFTGLDTKAQAYLHELFHHLHKSGISLILSAHFQTQMPVMTDSIIVLDRGEIINFQTNRV